MEEFEENMDYTPQGSAAMDSNSWKWNLDGMNIMDNEMLPPSLVQIEPILRVANEIDLVNPRVANFCRFHAFDKADRLDRASDNDGVRRLKSLLLPRLAREEVASVRENKTDPAEIMAFYTYYCEKYIQGLQNADKIDSTRLKKAYQTAAILFEVVKAMCPPQKYKIVKLHEQVAEKAAMYIHNVLPLDPESSDRTPLTHPGICSRNHVTNMKHKNNLKIPFQTIKDCTQDFNERNFMGKGGYGRVYKGILTWADHVNQLVAVKRLDVTGFQGFCDDNNEMILVYEYARHGSLDKYLRDPATPHTLSWLQLLKICIGIASALDYLHNHVAEKHRIIHRDVKSANILLDENWNAKLADFGLARIGLANQQNTVVITNLAGTHGYCDPQYERTGLLTKESDVYSFGVVLFEVLCGRLACVMNYHDERRFLHHLARTCYKNGELNKIIDHKIKKDIKPRTLLKFSAIAYQCLQETREERPAIAEVAFQLKEALKIQLEDEILLDEATIQDETSSMISNHQLQNETTLEDAAPS